MKNVGFALQKYFKSVGLTQQQIADKMGVAQPYVARLISGSTNFGKKTARAWCDEFGFSYSFLLTGEGSLFNTEEIIIEDAANDVASGDEPGSAEYWKAKYEEAAAEVQRLNGVIEGMVKTISIMQPSTPVDTQKENVG